MVGIVLTITGSTTMLRCGPVSVPQRAEGHLGDQCETDIEMPESAVRKISDDNDTGQIDQDVDREFTLSKHGNDGHAAKANVISLPDIFQLSAR
jgi:hypothetical protein